MKFRAAKMLGVAVGERSILLADVSSADGRCQLSRAAEFVYPPDVSLQTPDVLGKALDEFIRAQGFTARLAVFGIPAKWVLTKLRELPPVDPALAADMLRLQVETDFAPELKDLVYDYAGNPTSSGPSYALLAATPQRYIAQIEAIAEAARLQLRGIAPTTLVLSAATARSAADSLVLSITTSGTELSAWRGDTVALLRHVASGPATPIAVAGEVRRAALLLPRDAALENGASIARVDQTIIWDDAGIVGEPILAILGAGARLGDWSALDAVEVSPGVRASAAAVCLALGGMSEAGLPVDFLHSRLAVRRKSRVQRQTLLAIGAALILIVGGLVAWLGQRDRENVLATHKAALAQMEQNRKGAEAEVAMIRFAQGWHADNPSYLDCIRELALALPEDGQMYVINFNLHETMRGTASGKAPNEDAVLALDGRLKENSKRFSEVKTSFDSRETRGARDVSWSISFKYVPR